MPRMVLASEAKAGNGDGAAVERAAAGLAEALGAAAPATGGAAGETRAERAALDTGTTEATKECSRIYLRALIAQRENLMAQLDATNALIRQVLGYSRDVPAGETDIRRLLRLAEENC